MPIYEYQCEACGHHLEAFQKISDAPLTDCPNCQKPALAKQISSTSFQLKGTGWYATDFRDKGKKPAVTDSSASPAKTDKSSDSSSGTGSST